MQNRALIYTPSFQKMERRHPTFKSTFNLLCLILYCISWISLVTGDCPILINPEIVVVEFGSSVSVNCSTDVLHDGIGWEANEGSVPMTSTQNHTIWRVSSLRRWDSKPQCYILINRDQCERYLSITIYKAPNSVSISTGDPTGPMIEGSQYELQCDVVNVAPVQNLTVKWYKGEILVHRETFTDAIKSPLNKRSTLSITVDRTDDGVQYRCEAELELGPEGPQPPPKVTSERFNIIVHSKPIINETKLPSEVHVFRNYPEVLVCEAEGNPKPQISWSDRTGRRLDTAVGNLTITEFQDGDFYTCSASNSVNTTTRSVKLVIYDNNLPLVVCIVVAIVVVIIFISFCIYTSYYKNTKMGQYSLKNTPSNRKSKRGQTAKCL